LRDKYERSNLTTIASKATCTLIFYNNEETGEISQKPSCQIKKFWLDKSTNEQVQDKSQKDAWLAIG